MKKAILDEVITIKVPYDIELISRNNRLLVRACIIISFRQHTPKINRFSAFGHRVAGIAPRRTSHAKNAQLIKSVEASDFHYELRFSPILIIMGTWLPTNRSKEKGRTNVYCQLYSSYYKLRVIRLGGEAVLLVDD